MRESEQLKWSSVKCQVRDFVSLHRRGKLNLQPEFQRDGVWKLPARIKLIQSLVNHYPIPAVFLYRRKQGHKVIFDVIDGKQRLETILLFLGEIKRKEHSSFIARIKFHEDEDLEFEDWSWKEMSRSDRAYFLNYPILVIEVDGDAETIRDVFVRINSTGVALSMGEIQNAKYMRTKFLARVRDHYHERRILTLLGKMGVVTKSSKERMGDILLLSEIVMSVQRGELLDKKRGLSLMLDDRVSANNLTQTNKAIRLVDKAIDWAYRMLPDFAATRFKKTTDFYSLITLLADYLKSGRISTDKRRNAAAGERLRKFSQDLRRMKLRQRDWDFYRPSEIIRRYATSVRANSDSQGSRKDRREILHDMLKGIFAEKDRRRMYTKEDQLYVQYQARSRDGVVYCHLCGEPIENQAEFTLDHVKPHSKGGRTSLRNAKPAHRSCNSRKGNRNVKAQRQVYCSEKNCAAQGLYNYYSRKLLVRRGSLCSDVCAFSRIQNARRMMINDGILKETRHGVKFAQDYLFPTPSAAACFVTGMGSRNGKLSWRLVNDDPIKVLER